MTEKMNLDYEEWVEHVAQSIALLLTCMKTADRERILHRAQNIIQTHDETRDSTPQTLQSSRPQN